MSVPQPTWSLPVRKAEEPVLKIYNSLTRSKDVFVPQTGKHVKWYNCGPTVYDASHMGHARNYVTQDVLRRIMTDYFGYDVHFVMNVTDIDDKIIIRARQNHLFEKFRTETTTLSQPLIDQIQAAWDTYLRDKVSKGLPEAERPAGDWSRIVQQRENRAWRQACVSRDEKFDMHFASANRTYLALEASRNTLKAGTTGQLAAHTLIDESRDVISIALDDEFKETVTDPAISRKLAAYWEEQFFKDMARLRVKNPDTLTRVTEYVPEIVSFVEKIVQNGFAYEVDGSVYFDTTKFDAHDEHDYAKLQPGSKGNRELLQEGEGALSVSSGRRSASDFALWKGSKPGEPSWPSPWGAGRPGWHIECSVMASAVFGDNMDIHSGGIDLAFPHHDNEMAQSEAYHKCNSWVNYFVHTGHLHIEGLKMSKSLKNFITIDEILQKHSARQLRLAFVTQLWNAKVDFSESLMTGEVRTIETTLNNFFAVVKALVGQAEANGAKSDGFHHYEGPELDLTKHFYEAQSAFREALCDSYNTPVAIDVLRDLVSRVNVYINSRGKALNVGAVEDPARWVGKMLRVFGLGEGSDTELGWGTEQEGEGSNVNREEIAMPYARLISTFRDNVRGIAMGKGPDALKEILALCDKLRDTDLIPLGVALDDQEDGKALVKLVSPAELVKAREEKIAIAEAKNAKKAATAEADRLKKLARLEKGRVAPESMFKPPNVPTEMYGSWSETGLPLTDGEGKEVSKSLTKKVQKEWTAQKKLHDEFLASQQ